MEKYQIAIIGNGEPALVCTLSARKMYPTKNIAIIKTEKENSVIEDLLNYSEDGFDSSVTIIYDNIKSRINNTLFLNSGKNLKYEKLVVATGSRAIEPPIRDINMDGVHLINKDSEQINKIKRGALSAKNIIIYGGGYIGVQLCDELLHAGKNVTIIEKSKRLMPSSFDSDTSFKTKEIIESAGGKVILDCKIKSILGIDSINAVKLASDEIVECDFLMVCCGTRPNVEMADRLGIIYDRDRGILVDEYFRTSDKNIFAVGECAAKYDFFSSDLANVLLHNSKMEEAKLLGSNLYSIIFNRGKMTDYLLEKRSLKEKIKTELISMEALHGTKDYLPVQRM
jgi:NADPH-dependent 2,4-dienoyl-CoA reductase/sulfur reductase-like enzyme